MGQSTAETFSSKVSKIKMKHHTPYENVQASKRSSGQVECNTHSPAMFLSRNFSTKGIF